MCVGRGLSREYFVTTNLYIDLYIYIRSFGLSSAVKHVMHFKYVLFGLVGFVCLFVLFAVVGISISLILFVVVTLTCSLHLSRR